MRNELGTDAETPDSDSPTELEDRRSVLFMGLTPLRGREGRSNCSQCAHAGTISLKHVYEIATIKAKDEHMSHLSLENIARMVVGSAKSLGLQVVP